MDSYERTKHFLANLKVGDKVAVWRGWHNSMPDIKTVEKLTATTVAIKGESHRFDRTSGYEKGGSRSTWGGRTRISEITAEDLRKLRRARDIRTIRDVTLEDLSDEVLRAVANAIREAMKEQGSA